MCASPIKAAVGAPQTCSLARPYGHAKPLCHRLVGAPMNYFERLFFYKGYMGKFSG